MRISDWSSDVCSSDLMSRSFRGRVRHEADGAAGTILQCLDPGRVRGDMVDHPATRGQRQYARAHRAFRLAQQQRRVGRDRLEPYLFDQRGPLTTADALHETKAVDRGALERLRQRGGDGGSARLPPGTSGPTTE